VARFLIDDYVRYPKTVRIPDNSGRTPLSWASQCGWWNIVELLVEAWPQGVSQPDNCNRTPLLWAAERGNLRVVQMLLEKDPEAAHLADSSGRTPAQCAEQGGWGDIVALLTDGPERFQWSGVHDTKHSWKPLHQGHQAPLLHDTLTVVMPSDDEEDEITWDTLNKPCERESRPVVFIRPGVTFERVDFRHGCKGAGGVE
jgi:ankyrin repeat protein